MTTAEQIKALKKRKLKLRSEYGQLVRSGQHGRAMEVHDEFKRIKRKLEKLQEVQETG